MKTRFDKSKILTCVNADRAKSGDRGWVANTLPSLQEQVESHSPSTLNGIRSEDNNARFAVLYHVPGEGRKEFCWPLFYPVTYSYCQAGWVGENDLQVGDKVKVTRDWEPGENGFHFARSRLVPIGSVHTVTCISDNCIDTDGPWLPYFAIEKL